MPDDAAGRIGLRGTDAWRCLSGSVAVGAIEAPAAVSMLHRDVVVVDMLMVPPAKQRSVGSGGFAAIGPVGDGVVDFAEVRWSVASGPGAMRIAGGDCFAARTGEDARGSAEVQNL